MEPGNLIKTERLRRKLSQAALAKRIGISQVAIKKIETGETHQSKHIPRIAQELEIPLAKLDPSLSQYGSATVNQPAVQMEPSRSSPLQLIPGEQLMGRFDLPVYSIVHGGRTGALILSSEPYTSIARPQIVLGIKDAYGVLVKGNSMAREYNEGDIAYVDPHRHPKDGDPCIFQSHKEDGDVEAVIKYLARSPDASDSIWYVEQTNPPKRFTLKKGDWQVCHVVVGKQSANALSATLRSPEGTPRSAASVSTIDFGTLGCRISLPPMFFLASRRRSGFERHSMASAIFRQVVCMGISKTPAAVWISSSVVAISLVFIPRAPRNASNFLPPSSIIQGFFPITTTSFFLP